MTEAPTLVVLGGGPAQRHAIDAAHALGVRTLVCDSDPGVGDVPVSSEDRDGVRAAAAGAAGLIAPGTDWPVRVAAAVARDLGLPHPISPAVAVVATDKIAQRRGARRRRGAAAGMVDRRAARVPVRRQGARPAGAAGDVDPRRPGRSRGGGAAGGRSESRSGRVLFEAFVPGPEVTVNGFTAEGRASSPR